LASLSGRLENEENDLRINSGAVDAQLEWSGQGGLAVRKKPAREDMEAFETAYNAACGSISRGELVQGEVLLKRSKDLCDALEDLTEAEKKAEILPILVQQVYVLTQLGKIDEAEKLCSDLPIAEYVSTSPSMIWANVCRIRELSTRHIAQVNSISASKEQSNPYLSQRLMHSTPKPPPTDHHFAFQSTILRQNTYAMDLLCGKYPGVAESSSKYLKSQPSPTTSPGPVSIAVFNAAAHAHAQSGKAAIKEILPILEKRPSDIGLLLTITHLYLLTNNHAAATSLLESFFRRLETSATPADLDVRFAPGLVATMVSLYALQGRKSHSKNELARAASYWRRKSKTPPKTLLRAAGTALLDTHNEKDLTAAGEIFAGLHEADSTDRAACAGLVAAYAIIAPEKLDQQLVDSLPSVAKLVQGIDAEQLEDAGVASLPSKAPLTADASKKRTGDTSVKSESKKIRKSRMPKDYVEGKKMDEERWLPMKDRSYYRPKGRKGKARAAGLTQGGPVAEEKAVVVKVEPKVGGGGGAQKKKKGKGKGGKW
jgi:signal recognition particle subunit SRP72